MSLVVQIRGISGSGKSQVVKDLLKMADADSVNQHRFPVATHADLVSTDDEVAYTSFDLDGTPGAVLGRYDKASGGCDATKTQDQIVNRIWYLLDAGFDPILFESLMAATIAGRYIELAKALDAFHHRFEVAYLMTSRDQCFANIAARRATSKISRKPFDVLLFDRKNRCILNTRPKFDAERIVTHDLRYPDALPDLLEVLGHT